VSLDNCESLIIMKNVKILSSLLLTVGIVSVQAVPVQMPGGNWYDLVVDAEISWDRANAAANGAGGHLVTITSADEDKFVLGLIHAWQAALLGADLPSAHGYEFWAGGLQDPNTTSDSGANWTWVNGEGAFGYSNWADGEPNDAHGPASEQFLGLGLLGFIPTATWNDEAITGYIAGYVVEYERSSVPEGGVGVLGLLAVLALVATGRNRRA
jgi:hypothetical protein